MSSLAALPTTDELRRLAAEAPTIVGLPAVAYYLTKSNRELAGIVAQLTPDSDDLSDANLSPSEQRRLRLWAAARLAFEEQTRQRDERIQHNRARRQQAAIVRAEDLLRGAEVQR